MFPCAMHSSLPSLFCLVLGVTVCRLAVGQQCSLPASWRNNEYLQHYDPNADIPWVIKYLDGDEYVQYYYSNPSTIGPVVISFTCMSSAEVEGRHYHVRRHGSGDTYYCVETISQGDLAMLERTTQHNINLPAVECPNRVKPSEAAAWRVKYPFDVVADNCPFPPGTYQAEFSDGSGSRFCAGNPNSKVSLTNGNQLNIFTCESSSTYERPLQTTLFCVTHAKGTDLGSDSNAGDLVMLRYKDSNNRDRFYCARYGVNSDGELRLSLNVQNKKETFCYPDVSYNTVEQGKYIHFTLSKSLGAGVTPTLTPSSCDYPEAWRSIQWWYEQRLNIAGNVVTGRTLYEFGEDAFGVYANTALLRTEVCVDQFVSPQNAYNHRLSTTYVMGGPNNPRSCLEHTKVANNVVLEKKETEVGDNIPAYLCKMGRITEARALVKSPFQYGTANPYSVGPGYRCPVEDGTYYLSHSESATSQAMCEGEASSTLTVAGDIMTLNSCTPSYTYERPYRGTLRCVATWPASVIDPNGGSRGNFTLLARVLTDGAHATGFYCARYKAEGNRFYLSLNVNDKNKAMCDTAADAKTFSDAPGARFRLLTLASSLVPGGGGGDGPFNPPDNVTPPAGCTRNCLNGGLCVVHSDGRSTCDCRPGSAGIVCEKTLPRGLCSQFWCNNATTISCVDNGGFYQCVCKPGYEGPQCKVDTDDCLSSPCQNGGTCVDGVGVYDCVCPQNYLGRHCTEVVAVAWLEKNDTTIIIILVVVLSVFVLACVAIAVLICQCRGKKADARAVEERLKITEDVGQPGLDGLPGQSYTSFQAWYPDYRNENTLNGLKDEDTLKKLQRV